MCRVVRHTRREQEQLMTGKPAVPTKVEQLKADSEGLAGDIYAEVFDETTENVSEGTYQLLKFHGRISRTTVISARNGRSKDWIAHGRLCCEPSSLGGD